MFVSSLALACASCVAGAASGPPSTADAPSAEVVELRERVARLEGRLSEMAAADGERWLSEERAADIRDLVQDVLADADTRASLQATGASAGFEKGKGFFIQSEDGNYLLRVQAHYQFRFVWNEQDNSPTDDDRYGFENRRTKLWFRGHIIDPSWTYDIELSSSRSSGTFSEGENLFVQKDFGSGFKVRFGQFKPWFLREEMVPATQLLAVERSNVNSRYTVGVTQGIEAMFTSGMFRASASIIDGFKASGNLNGGNANWNAEDSEFAATARVEFLPMGEWKDAVNDNGFRGTANTLLIGAGLAYAKGEYGTGVNGAPPDFNNNETDDLRLTADAMFKTGGFSVAGGVIYRMIETDSTAPAPIDRDELAFVARAGFFLTDDIELYGLYEWGDLDVVNTDDLSTLTVGVTKYFDRHWLKWSTDIGFGFDTVSSDWADAAAGWRADAPGEDGQIVVRSQLQLAF